MNEICALLTYDKFCQFLHECKNEANYGIEWSMNVIRDPDVVTTLWTATCIHFSMYDIIDDLYELLHIILSRKEHSKHT